MSVGQDNTGCAFFLCAFPFPTLPLWSPFVSVPLRMCQGQGEVSPVQTRYWCLCMRIKDYAVSKDANDGNHTHQHLRLRPCTHIPSGPPLNHSNCNLHTSRAHLRQLARSSSLPHPLFLSPSPSPSPLHSCCGSCRNLAGCPLAPALGWRFLFLFRLTVVFAR